MTAQESKANGFLSSPATLKRCGVCDDITTPDVAKAGKFIVPHRIDQYSRFRDPRNSVFRTRHDRVLQRFPKNSTGRLPEHSLCELPRTGRQSAPDNNYLYDARGRQSADEGRFRMTTLANTRTMVLDSLTPIRGRED